MGVKTGFQQEFSPSSIDAAVSPMLLRPLHAAAYPLLARYLRLLSHWNKKMNLTAVRDRDLQVRLHLAECLRAAQTIPAGVKTVLDFGSGAGFPGIPIQIARPELQVTLAESQKKKAAFLQEAVRELRLSGASVHPGRVEDLAAALVFDLVTLRAVDRMAEAVQAALTHIRSQRGTERGILAVLTSISQVPEVIAASRVPTEPTPVTIDWLAPDLVPGTKQRVILLGYRVG
jgi:16S rRNA (guanine527-N7)-methyltransferase